MVTVGIVLEGNRKVQEDYERRRAARIVKMSLLED